MKDLLTKWISRSLVVFGVATWLLKTGTIDKWTWLITGLAYLGYNLAKDFPGLVGKKD